MGRNNYYPPELKKRIVSDARSERNISGVARRYGVSRNSLHEWIAEDQQGLLEHERLPVNSSEVERMAKELAKLKQLLGEKELENAILKDLVKKTSQHSTKKSK